MAKGIDSLLSRPKTYEQKAFNKFINENSKNLLQKFSEILDAQNLKAKEIEEKTMQFLEKEGEKLKNLAQPLRVAITGTSISPSIFEVIEILGVNEIKLRIENLIKNKESL